MLLSLCQASLADGENNRHRLYEMTSVLWDAVKADIALCVCLYSICLVPRASVHKHMACDNQTTSPSTV